MTPPLSGYWPWRLPFSAFSMGGGKGRLSVVIYHRISRKPDPMVVDTLMARTFIWQVEFLARHCNVLPLTEAVERMQAGTLPPRAVCISFDDGYADNLEVAAQLLRQYDLPAAFFVTAGFLNGGAMWNDRILEVARRCEASTLDAGPLGSWPVQGMQQRAAAAEALIQALKYCPTDEREQHLTDLERRYQVQVPQDLLLSGKQLRQLVALPGMEVGAHTMTHPILARLDSAQAQAEIVDSKQALEAEIGRDVQLFAYPNGKIGEDFNIEHVDMVRQAGFKAAVTTEWAANDATTDPMQLSRFSPWSPNPAHFGLRLAQNWSQAKNG